MAAINHSKESSFESSHAYQISARVDLEAGISAKTTSDSVIFPDLQKVYALTDAPEWVRGLTFPERLLNKTLDWKKYDEKKLSSDHSLFQHLNDAVVRIKSSQADPVLQPIANSLQKIGALYQRYIREVCAAEGKKRRVLLKGPARLTGFLHGNSVCKELRQQDARLMCSVDRYNGDLRGNAFGASAVYRDAEQNVFYKRAYKNPLSPGEEYIFNAFNAIFLGGRTAQSKLFKLTDIAVRNAQGEKSIGQALRRDLALVWPAQREADPSISYARFIRNHPGYESYPFEESKRNFLVQTSLGIRGDELIIFLENQGVEELEKEICSYNYSAMVLLALILRVTDGRADNYILEKKENRAKKDIVGIDNDHILRPPIHAIPGEGGHLIELRSILFLFPHLMEQKIDQELVHHFSQLNLEKRIVDWLYRLEQYNQSLDPFVASKMFSLRDMGSLSLPIRLPLSAVLSLYFPMKRLQDSLKKDPELTHNALFTQLFPIIHKAYQVLLDKHQGDALHVQNALFDFKEAPTLEKTLQMSREEVQQEIKGLPGMETETPPLPIQDVLERYLEKVIPALSAQEQEKLLEHTMRTFKGFKNASLKGVKFSNVSLLRLVERGECHEVVIEDSEEITPKGVLALLNDNPKLKIVIGYNKQFTSPALVELIELAQKMGRPLFYRIKEKEHSLAQKNLDALIEPAIYHGHFALAEALLRFGVNLQRSDKKGNTLLHRVAARGTAQSIHFLVEHCHFPIGILNHQGQSAFHKAAKGGKKENLEVLIHLEGGEKKGLSVKDKEGRTPFNTATYHKNYEAVAFLLHEILTHLLPAGEKLHLDKDPEGYTLLHMAAKFGLNDEIVQLIDRFQFDVNVRGQNDRTPLHMAAFNNQAATAIALLEKGASVNAQADLDDGSTTPLHDAVSFGHKKMVHILCQSKELDVLIPNAKEFSPLQIAVCGGDFSIVSLLLSHPSYTFPEKGPDSIARLIELAQRERQFHLLPMLYTEGMVNTLQKIKQRDPKAAEEHFGVTMSRLEKEFAQAQDS